MDRFFCQLAVFAYLLATAGFLVHIITLKKGVERIATGFLVAGFCLHTLSVAFRWVAAGHPPLVNLHESLSFFAWATVGAYLAFQWKLRVKALGAFVTPVATVIMTASSMQPSHIMPLSPALKSIWLPIHATICLVADAVFLLAFCLAVMYLLQERQIKAKKLGAVFKRLPSLQTLDAMSNLCLKIGFPLLTLGIVTGSIWAEQAWGSYWSWDPKETWSLITWFVYAALLHQRLAIGWQGRRAAIMTIIGFATLIFTFLGVSLLLPGEHTYSTWYE